MTSVGEWGFPVSSVVKNLPAMKEMQIQSLESPRGGNGNPFQYSCLENPMDIGAWRAILLRVTQSQTQLM